MVGHAILQNNMIHSKRVLIIIFSLFFAIYFSFPVVAEEVVIEETTVGDVSGVRVSVGKGSQFKVGQDTWEVVEVIKSFGARGRITIKKF